MFRALSTIRRWWGKKDDLNFIPQFRHGLQRGPRTVVIEIDQNIVDNEWRKRNMLYLPLAINATRSISPRCRQVIPYPNSASGVDASFRVNVVIPSLSFATINPFLWR